jgi:maltose alpha-D-glucosyltransferase / alpha-amylase
MRREINKAPVQVDTDPHWYKTGVIYQLHIRSFFDSDGNGIGDFRGLIQKLDYLQDLGVTAVWILPFYPSPLKDDGYDIADYTTINPIYGELADFKLFLKEAHRRGLRVITELVINHTSDQHPWFQRSRRAPPGSRWRDFYVWSDTPEKYKEARIIFKDFETSNWSWDPVANAYFWHRFYSHQPDLNFDNPQVHKEILKVLDFWLDLGVDGLRLDAVPYLYEREGTSCENLPETHEYLKGLRRHMDEKYQGRMLLAEANQWPEDAVAYFGSGKGDECHMAFHFPLMPRLFMAVRMEDRVPIVDILEQTPAIPETAQWAVFLRNHDELTLEMVTDEERDYMYRMYANDQRARINLGIRRRLAPLMGNDRKRIELLNALLITFPGTPVLYYGDEIGMGENIFLGDRNGVRTPMQWSSDRNAGFSRANPQGLYLPIVIDPEYHYETVNVEAQQQNIHSLLWWTRRLLALRKRWSSFGQGTFEFLHPENRKILAYVRRGEDQCVLVVANLSRFPQPVELDLSPYNQVVPVELFGGTEFPRITEKPYFLTLSPHSFYFFSLEPVEPREQKLALYAQGPPVLKVTGVWENVFRDKMKAALEKHLEVYIRERRWFGGKGNTIKSVTIKERVEVVLGAGKAFLTLIEVDYQQADPEVYQLPLTFASEGDAEFIRETYPNLVVARLEFADGGEGILFDAVGSKGFGQTLLEAISRRRSFRGSKGEALGSSTPALRQIRGEAKEPLEPVLGKAEQSNSALIFGDRLILKLFRRLDIGTNPDLEIGRYLTSREFPHVPPVAGALEYAREDGQQMSLGILSGLVPNATDAWDYTLDTLGRYYDRVQSLPPDDSSTPEVEPNILKLTAKEIPPFVSEMIGTYLESARILGSRTAGLHLVLASETENKDFSGEPFTPHYQRSLYQSMRNLAMEKFQLLRRKLPDLPESVAPIAARVVESSDLIMERFRPVFQKKIKAIRCRIHGDYHLGQVLYTGKDFVIIDFEGEPARSISERRIKRSPLKDVAGMLRSFHYATYATLYKRLEQGSVTPEQFSRIEPWAQFWHAWVSAVYLKTYLEETRSAGFLPASEEELEILLEAYVMEKAIYELGYEVNNRPEWLKIPLQGLLQLVSGHAAA